MCHFRWPTRNENGDLKPPVSPKVLKKAVTESLRDLREKEPDVNLFTGLDKTA